MPAVFFETKTIHVPGIMLGAEKTFLASPWYFGFLVAWVSLSQRHSSPDSRHSRFSCFIVFPFGILIRSQMKLFENSWPLDLHGTADFLRWKLKLGPQEVPELPDAPNTPGAWRAVAREEIACSPEAGWREYGVRPVGLTKTSK